MSSIRGWGILATKHTAGPSAFPMILIISMFEERGVAFVTQASSFWINQREMTPEAWGGGICIPHLTETSTDITLIIYPVAHKDGMSSKTGRRDMQGPILVPAAGYSSRGRYLGVAAYYVWLFDIRRRYIQAYLPTCLPEATLSRPTPTN